MIQTLSVPDDLIRWGKDPEVAVHFASPWAHEVEELAFQSQVKPLDSKILKRFFSRLEGLCAAALQADRHELLLGFDMWTAEYLGLRYRFETSTGPVTLGARQDWTYGEMRVVLAASAPKEAFERLVEAKRFLADVFPTARVESVSNEGPSVSCSGCGTVGGTAMVELTTGGAFCTNCWREIATPWPKFDSRGRKVEKQ
jgi:hypothetical protein